MEPSDSFLSSHFCLLFWAETQQRHSTMTLTLPPTLGGTIPTTFYENDPPPPQEHNCIAYNMQCAYAKQAM